MNLREKQHRSPEFRQIQFQHLRQFLLPIKRFGIFHGRPTTIGKAIALTKRAFCTPSDFDWAGKNH